MTKVERCSRGVLVVHSDETRQMTVKKRPRFSLGCNEKRKLEVEEKYELHSSLTTLSTMASDLDKQIEMLRRCVRINNLVK